MHSSPPVLHSITALTRPYSHHSQAFPLHAPPSLPPPPPPPLSLSPALLAVSPLPDFLSSVNPYQGYCAVVGCSRFGSHPAFHHKGLYHGARLPEESCLPLRIDEGHKRICFQCLDLHRRGSGRFIRDDGRVIPGLFNKSWRYHTTARGKSLYGDYENVRPHPCIVVPETEASDSRHTQEPFVHIPEGSDWNLVQKAALNAEENGGRDRDSVDSKKQKVRRRPKRLRTEAEGVEESALQSREDDEISAPELALVEPTILTSRTINPISIPSLRIRALENESSHYAVYHRFSTAFCGKTQTIVTDVLAYCTNLHRANLLALQSLAGLETDQTEVTRNEGCLSIVCRPTAASDIRHYAVFVERLVFREDEANAEDVDLLVHQLSRTSTSVESSTVKYDVGSDRKPPSIVSRV